MKIGYQGDIGSNSEAAAKIYYLNNNIKTNNNDTNNDDDKNNNNNIEIKSKKYEFIPLLNSINVFNKLMNEEIDVGVAAIKNSIAGEVLETKNALMTIESNFISMITTITISIHHCLFTFKNRDIKQCKVVMSHPQALKQTKKVRKQKFSWLSELEIGDQAKAAKDLSEGKYPSDYAVICRKNAGEASGLTLIEENIEDDPSNETTFGIFVKIKKNNTIT
ncbi:hypothetical protein BCR32DRAFT_276024 [Anaeromyces robustus]|uniref:Prephenate dehydratase domain-containing protein n=1 Tax=Anaeromyces robustus TaxID=1754192 RepID=A0A1Y1XJ74_9FUNG|nr:hypothetical protein BCR32DRAFT_276024 [Anaeromyces robustus]|eukprot:ORX85809.1 hypothetical protein BCR32DRAFT_276024 [Anaeromyces robustus]